MHCTHAFKFKCSWVPVGATPARLVALFDAYWLSFFSYACRAVQARSRVRLLGAVVRATIASPATPSHSMVLLCSTRLFPLRCFALRPQVCLGKVSQMLRAPIAEQAKQLRCMSLMVAKDPVRLTYTYCLPGSGSLPLCFAHGTILIFFPPSSIAHLALSRARIQSGGDGLRSLHVEAMSEVCRLFMSSPAACVLLFFIRPAASSPPPLSSFIASCCVSFCCIGP